MISAPLVGVVGSLVYWFDDSLRLRIGHLEQTGRRRDLRARRARAASVTPVP